MENRLLFARHVKNNRPQPLPLCSDMVAILQEYLTYREGKAHEPLFPSDADQPMTENGLRCSVANYNRKRGVEKTSNLMQLIAKNNMELMMKIRILTQGSLRKKLMLYFSILSREQHSTTITLPFGRDKLANYLFCDRSAVSRELGRMDREGLIQLGKTEITLL